MPSSSPSTHSPTPPSSMASGSKRPRSADDVDGDIDDEVEIESASSSFRHGRAKRSKLAKVALAHARGGASVSDTEDDEDPAHYDDFLEGMGDDGNGQEDSDADSADNRDQDTGMALDADTEHSLRQHSDHEEEEDDIDEYKFTQVVRKQFGNQKENMAMEEGIIEQVVCRNFMCHSWFKIDLGPLINFIVGHNGSGKSAVLTALTMCLGGKATATNRGGSLKSLIKEGQENASLSVKIKNQGENAYKPDLYGRSIIVERHFSRSGSSGFKIKNEKDRIVSTKKAELDDILDFFSLQLDNPINVLTQDMARQFLSNSTPSDKYKFFIRGTNLETLDSDYNIFEEQLDGIIEKLRVRDEDLVVLSRKLKEAEARKKLVENTDRILEKVRAIQRQHAWAQVGEQEALLARYNGDVEAQQTVLRDAEEKAEAVGGRYEAAETAHDAAKRAVEQFDKLLETATQAHASAREKWDANRVKIEEGKIEERSIRDTIKSNKSEAVQLEEQIKQETTRLNDQGGAEHVQRLEDLEDLKRQAAEAKAEEDRNNARLPELEQARSAAEEKKKAAEADKADASRIRGAAQAKLRKFQQEQGEKFEPYHRTTKNLCDLIEKETRWRLKPVGPLGLHVQLLKPEWSLIVEKTMGNILNAYTVTCKDDQNILKALARRAGSPNVVVYICPTDPLDTNGKEPNGDVDTILRVVRINSPAVRNVLIINQAIEQVVLIKDSQQAVKYFQSRPRNVKATVTFAQGGLGTRFDVSRTGGFRSNPIQPWQGTTRMKTDREEQLRAHQEAVREAERDLAQAEERFRELRGDFEKAKQAVERHKRTQKDLKTTRQEKEEAVSELQEQINSNRPKDGRLQELQRQLEQNHVDLEKFEGSFQDHADIWSKWDEIALQLKPELDAAQHELNQAELRVKRANEKVEEADGKRQGILHEKNAAIGEIEQNQRHVSRIEDRRNAQEKTLHEHVEGATGVSQRVAVPEGMTPDLLDKRLEQLKDQYREAQERAGGSREDLTRIFVEADKTYRTAKNEMKEMDAIRKVLTGSLQERRRRWRLFRKYISVRAKINFSYLLSEREFRGRVLLDHSNKQLDIAVEPDMSRRSDSGRQAKTLSGGEKSFSTICLLLSIWEAMGSPIRCLDEFDVFMDSVNRSQSMRLMIQTARRSVGRQFILITPQSMDSVTDSNGDVRIHKMSDPERGQQSLNFSG